jgi:hypothetical protein
MGLVISGPHKDLLFQLIDRYELKDFIKTAQDTPSACWGELH